MVLLEKFGVGAETKELDKLFRLVHPDKEIVVLDVALHAPDVVARQEMRFVLTGNLPRIT